MPEKLTEPFPARTTSAEQTRLLGETFGQSLRRGDVVALFGELGSGKTQFVKGICEAFDIDASLVSSPTFTIIHEYDADPVVFHLDLYRLKSMEEAMDLGIEEYLESNGICVIEWPDKIEHILPDRTIGIRLTHVAKDERLIQMSEAAI